MQAVRNGYILSLEEATKMVAGYLTRPEAPVAVDLETTGLDPYTSRLVAAQFKQFGRPAIIYDLRHVDPSDLESFASVMKNLFSVQPIVGMNIKFDIRFLKAHLGIEPTRVYDVMLAEQVIRGGAAAADGSRRSYSMEAIADSYDLPVSKEERKIFPDMDKGPYWNEPFSEELLSYMIQDVAIVETIYYLQQPLISERSLWNGVALENDVVVAMADMENNGIGVDSTAWMDFIDVKAAKAERLGERLIGELAPFIVESRKRSYVRMVDYRQEHEHELTAFLVELNEKYNHLLPTFGEKPLTLPAFKKPFVKEWRETHKTPPLPKLNESPMNLSSSAQVLACLRAMGVTMELSEWNKEKRKLEVHEELINTTAAKELDKLMEGQWPTVDVFLDWRKTNKFVTSFGRSLIDKINPVTQRLHPSYLQCEARTSRMSCREPNFQQFPGGDEGKKLRRCVQASPGNVLLTADFSNIEMRILADLTGDAYMLSLFADGKDLHCETARMMFGLDTHLTADEIKEMRSPLGFFYRVAAKTINFGLVYGMSAKRLALQLKISLVEAEKLMMAYFNLYPGVKAWLDKTGEDGLATLQSTTLGGHVRYYSLPPKGHPDYKRLSGSIVRQAKNTPIQGTSADITKRAVANFYRDAPRYAKLVAVVHDEIVVECPHKHAEEVREVLINAMDEAGTYYLKNVAWLRTTVNIDRSWEKK